MKSRHTPSKAIAALVLLSATIGTVELTGVAGAADTVSPARPASHATNHGHHGPRVGGRVHDAWPGTGHAPRNRVNRWLARQVGATKPKACANHRRNRCQPAGHNHGRGRTAAISTVSGDPGSPPGQLAKIIPATPAPVAARATTAREVKLPLQLVRSFEIPADDPSYERLLNWSWTYDSAVAAAAFASTDDRENSAQLLDQLAALQRRDGSIEIAFDTATGESAPVFRSGTVAWVGLAAATYDRAFGSDQYLDTERRAADYLLSLQTADGLIAGGPGVKWVSTLHNLIAFDFLARLGSELEKGGDTKAAERYEAAAKAISAAIDANLLVADKSGAHFRQGLEDDTQALDVQALGAMYLQGTDRRELAAQVLAYARDTFAIGDRSVDLSKEPATYNMTYSAAGPYSGYAPYAGRDAPDVLWAEGAGEVRLAEDALGQDTSASDKSIAAWAAITADRKQGPLQSDRTVNSDAFGVEYHVWPASTAAAWTVLSKGAPAFFAAPLPGAAALLTGTG